MSEVPEEFSEFLFAPKDNPDGTEPTDEEERRRLAMLRYWVHRYAAEAGIEIKVKGETAPEPAISTERSIQIVQVARETMPAADDKVRNSFERLKVESPDGWKISASRFRLGVLDDLGEAIKKLADTPKDAAVEIVKALAGRGIRLCISVGTLIKARVAARGEASMKSEAEE